jgi:hypothetical protein
VEVHGLYGDARLFCHLLEQARSIAAGHELFGDRGDDAPFRGPCLFRPGEAAARLALDRTPAELGAAIGDFTRCGEEVTSRARAWEIL